MSRIHRLIVPGAVAGVLGIVAGVLWTIPWLFVKDDEPNVVHHGWVFVN